jgi:type IX secretion system PorP/SprF family membrane protein
VCAQDPHLSQFFTAPHFINPALVGTQYGTWSVMGNIRQQWGNASTPFNTQVVGGEVKLIKEQAGSNFIALGMTLMNDQTMNGAFRNNYANASLAYHLVLSPNHRLAAGFQGAYGHRRLDYSRLTFGTQFTGRGFDLAVSSGESSLYAMKPFASLSTGILYTYLENNGDFLLDFGLASYDINRPNQSFLKDSQNLLNVRHVAYLNIQSYRSDNVFYQFSGIYHRQARQNYYSLGGALGFSLAEEWEKMFLLGCWFREGDAIYPYVGYRLGGAQFGLSYDITFSKQNLGPSNPRSLELSFIYTGIYPRQKGLKCPYWNRYLIF